MIHKDGHLCRLIIFYFVQTLLIYFELVIGKLINVIHFIKIQNSDAVVNSIPSTFREQKEVPTLMNCA